MDNNPSSFGNTNAGNVKLKSFKVYKPDIEIAVKPTYTRRDYRKIYLITGETHIHFAGNWIHCYEPILFFEPQDVFTLQQTVNNPSDSFCCTFSPALLEYSVCSKSYKKLLAKAEGADIPVFPLNGRQKGFITDVFEKLILVQETGYIFNHELFDNYMNLIFHEVLKQLV